MNPTANPIGRALCATALLLTGALLPVGSVTAEEEFTPLFNGKDLSGWTGQPGIWRVEDGEIIGSSHGVKLEHNTFLSTEKSYSDFVLRAKVKLINHNSGIQFRSDQLEDFAVAGYQADVAEKTYFGMLYEEKKRGILPYWNEYTEDEKAAVFAAANLDGWNEYEITCEGDHVKMVLNGYTTLDFKDPEGAKAGIIALQIHTGPEMEVRFKDITIKELNKKKTAVKDGELMPDFEAREAKMAFLGERFRLPDGFSVEEVASDALIGSVINMTFDHLGRPVLGAQDDGVRILLDEDGDGIYDAQKSFSEQVKRIMALHYLAPGDLLVQGNGAEGPGLYRLTDENGDDEADQVKLLMKSDGGMGEHGPHAVLRGPDGYVYIQYGNHAHPIVDEHPLSPSRNLQEDYFLERYVDPRGHANNIMAPGGTILRVDPEFTEWHQLAAGFRNAYDMSMDATGELFTFDSDMEWDYGLPWFRPVRVIHAVPGGDYGWRTGSSKMPDYYLDTLPGVDDVGRGSPVGVAFYQHDAFPESYKGAFFMGDWSRGRIRVIFPKAEGATFAGDTVDFLVGEPLNVTDLDVGPDGALYFTLGGRGTHGGLYRVTYGDAIATPTVPTTIEDVLTQPMPRSAWGRHALTQAKEALGAEWATGLQTAVANPEIGSIQRIRALEALQVYGPQPTAALLSTLARDPDALVRGGAVFLMGADRLERFREPLINALYDKDPTVARRACEALIRAGLNESTRVESHEGLISGLYLLLDHKDRHLRYAARHTLERIHRDLWSDHILSDDFERRPRGVLEGMLALIETQRAANHADAIFTRLEALSRQPMEEAILLDFLRVVQMAFIRDVTDGDRLAQFKAALGGRMLAQFPAEDLRVNRELQAVIAYLQPPGAIDALLAYLTPDKSREEQIHTMYALRTISEGWTEETRNQAVAWFDRGREMDGAASMEGFINNMWDSLLTHLPETERVIAQERKAKALAERAEKAAALLAEMEGEAGTANSDLAQMSFEELADYLEYDPMAYREQKLEDGEKVFLRARCANCHVFGTKGKGGGPDLSTVTSRFRRRDILEAIMYPSKVVSDQYTGLELELDDFSTVTGMVVGENESTLTLITVHGERMEIPRETITKQTITEKSIMPEGLLNTMSLRDLVNLVYFLENGAEE